MAIDVYEYGRGGKCVYMFTYTYAGFREMKIDGKGVLYCGNILCRIIYSPRTSSR